jgi:hypothetical protein
MKSTDATQAPSWKLKSDNGGGMRRIAIGFGISWSRCTQALNKRPFVPHVKIWEPCYFTEVPDGPPAYALNVFWLQEKGDQIHKFKWGQSLTLTKKCGLRFPLSLNIFWLQETGAQIHISEWGQSLTFTKNVHRGFLFHSTPPTQWTVQQPSRWKCLLRVLCPVRRPVTALDWVLLKDRNLALAPWQGPEISSRACLCISPRPFTSVDRHYFHSK